VVGSHPYLRRFTFLPRARIEELEAATASVPGQRQAQRALALEVTTMVHGAAEAHRAEQAAAVLFTPGIAGLDPVTLEKALADAPTTDVGGSELDAGSLTVFEAVLRSGLADSRRAARQLLEQGSVYVNGVRVAEDRSLARTDVLHGRWIVLRRGPRTQQVLAVRE
jgi:tyrosyl-tRNA synthetase